MKGSGSLNGGGWTAFGSTFYSLRGALALSPSPFSYTVQSTFACLRSLIQSRRSHEVGHVTKLSVDDEY